MKTCGIAGDWHVDLDWAVARLRDFARLGVTEVLHVGDFGLFADPDAMNYLRTVSDVSAELGITLRVTMGNHDNYVMYEAMIENEDGWLYDPEFPNILFAKRGQRWEWNGVSFVSLGGGNSINKADLTIGYDWWPQEQIGLGDIYRTREGGYADIFIAHDAPEGVALFEDNHRHESKWSLEAVEYAQKSRQAMRQAVDGVKPGLFLHGHYHHLMDLTTELEDENGEPYTLHSIGLNMNGFKGNIALLHLDTREVEVIDYEV